MKRCRYLNRLPVATRKEGILHQIVFGCQVTHCLPEPKLVGLVDLLSALFFIGQVCRMKCIDLGFGGWERLNIGRTHPGQNIGPSPGTDNDTDGYVCFLIDFFGKKISHCRELTGGLW